MKERELWGPEMAAERMMAKRLRSAIEKEGLCSACKYRDDMLGLGRFHCLQRPERQHPSSGCDKEGTDLPRFEFDPGVMKRFQGAIRG